MGTAGTASQRGAYELPDQNSPVLTPATQAYRKSLKSDSDPTSHLLALTPTYLQSLSKFSLRSGASPAMSASSVLADATA